jgi:hypothetical protein
MCKRDNVITALVALGYQETHRHRGRKYRHFEHEDHRTILIGRSGAVRVLPRGRSAVADSLSLTDTRCHCALVAIGEHVGRVDADYRRRWADAEFQRLMRVEPGVALA